MPLSRVARISGRAYQTVKKMDGEREFKGGVGWEGELG
jgi:hypothetical protein